MRFWVERKGHFSVGFENKAPGGTIELIVSLPTFNLSKCHASPKIIGLRPPKPEAVRVL